MESASAARSNGRRRAARRCAAWTSFCFRPSSPPRPTSRSGCPHPSTCRSTSASAAPRSRTLRFRSNPNAEPLSIERASLAGSVDADRLELASSSCAARSSTCPATRTSCRATRMQTSGRLDWIVRPGEYPEARGSTRFSGNLAALTIEQRVEAPYDARVDLRVEEPLTALRLDGEVAFTDAAGSVRHRAGAGGDGRLHAVVPRHARGARSDRARGARGRRSRRRRSRYRGALRGRRRRDPGARPRRWRIARRDSRLGPRDDRRRATRARARRDVVGAAVAVARRAAGSERLGLARAARHVPRLRRRVRRQTWRSPTGPKAKSARAARATRKRSRSTASTSKRCAAGSPAA